MSDLPKRFINILTSIKDASEKLPIVLKEAEGGSSLAEYAINLESTVNSTYGRMLVLFNPRTNLYADYDIQLVFYFNNEIEEVDFYSKTHDQAVVKTVMHNLEKLSVFHQTFTYTKVTDQSIIGSQIRSDIDECQYREQLRGSFFTEDTNMEAVLKFFAKIICNFANVDYYFKSSLI